MSATGQPVGGSTPLGVEIDDKHPLFPVLVRFERARQQKDELLDAVTAALRLNKGSMTRESDPKTGEHVWRFHRPKLEVLWGVIIGEIVHDLRSCLDHLVCILVEHDGGVPGRHTGFPICTKKREFRSHLARGRRWTGKLVGLRPASIALIAKHQPCHSGQDGHTVPIYLLEVLWNIDKHRTVHLLVAETELVGPISFKATPPATKIWTVAPGPLKDGAEVCRIPGGTYADVEVKANTGTDVLLDKTWDARPNTRNIGPILHTLVIVVERIVVSAARLMHEHPAQTSPPPPPPRFTWYEWATRWVIDTVQRLKR